MPERATAHRAADPRRNAAIAEKLMRERGRYLRNLAQHHAPLHRADDALQTALVLLIERFDLDEQHAIGWLTTTLKREAWDHRRRDRRDAERAMPPHPDGEFDPVELVEAGILSDPHHAAESRQEAAAIGALLGELKPDECDALGLLAQGFSYRDIMEARGWTYTKVNRCVAEGRERMRAILAERG